MVFKVFIKRWKRGFNQVGSFGFTYLYDALDSGRWLHLNLQVPLQISGEVQVRILVDYIGKHGTRRVNQNKIGSLGFRIIDEFNPVLMAKPLWRLI